jgi:hypothetical protein
MMPLDPVCSVALRLRRRRGEERAARSQFFGEGSHRPEDEGEADDGRTGFVF